MSHAADAAETVATPLGRAVDWLIRRRWALLVAAIVLTVLAWPLSQRLAFEQSIESLYAVEDPHLRDFLFSRGQFGGDEFLFVAYPEDNLFQPDSHALTDEAVERINAFAAKLNEIPGVIKESTQNLATALRFPYGRDRIRQIVRGVLLGEDERTTAIVLRLAPEDKAPVSRGDTIARVRKIASEHNPPAMVVGEPAQIHDMFRYVEEDGRKLFAVSLALLAFVLLLLLQRLRWVIVAMLVVLVSIAWTEAVLVLSQLRLSMVSSMLSSLMTIISVATVTHMSLYFREYRRALPPCDAMRETLRELASPIWWAIATTALGFGVLVSSHINPVRSFGVMMALGSLLVLVAVVVVVPCTALLGRHLPEPEPTAGDRRVAAALGRITLWVEHHPRRVTIASLALAAFAATGFLWLRVETDFSKNFRQSSPIVQALDFFESRLGGAGSWEVNFPAPRELDAEYLNRVRRFAEELRKEFGVAADGDVREDPRSKFAVDSPIRHAGRISKVLVLTDGLDLVPERVLFRALPLQIRIDLLSRVQREFVNSLYNSRTGRMRLLLRAYERQPSGTKLQLIADVERRTRDTFGDAVSVVSATTRTAAIMPVADTELAVAATHPAEETEDSLLKSVLSGERVTTADAGTSFDPGASAAKLTRPNATGLFVLLAFLIESLMADQWTTFGLAATGITGMMWFAFRSLPFGLMSLVPNVFPNVLVVGLMGWIGLPVNIATAMISCVSMGLTVDSSILYLSAYQRSRSRGMSVFEALHATHRHVGQAVVYSNLALMAGFSVLSLSHFVPLIYFGLLVSLAMLGGLIGNLVFLPLLIGWWDGRKIADCELRIADSQK